MKDLTGRFCLLALSNIFFLNPDVAVSIMSEVEDIAEIFRGNRKRFRSLFGNKKRLFESFKNFGDWDSVKRQSEVLNELGVEVVAFGDENYPRFLHFIDFPPCVLYIRGRNVEMFDENCVAIVGSRKCSRHAYEKAVEISYDLALSDYCVVSGLAYGIDSAAHKGVLKAGGSTISVLGCGIDIIYPRSNKNLYDEITERGLLISEFPQGMSPEKYFFPQRNRIISGLSLGVLIAEAARRSGSLITASCAANQGRDVYVLPGSAGMYRTGGSNGLLKDGAIPVESADEIVFYLNMEIERWSFLKRTGHLENYIANDSPLLKDLPKRGSVGLDYLVSKSELTISGILKELSELMIGGLVEELPGKKFRRIKG